MLGLMRRRGRAKCSEPEGWTSRKAPARRGGAMTTVDEEASAVATQQLTEHARGC